MKTFLLDIMGVLLDGGELIDGAVEAVRLIQSVGCPARFLTNASRRNRTQLHQELVVSGLNISENQIYTAPLAARDYVLSNGLRPWCLVHPNLNQELASAPYGEANAVIIGDAAEDLSYQNLNQAFRLCLEGARLVAIGHNKYFKQGDAFFLDSGPFVEAIEYAVGCQAIITGKPAADFFEQALADVNSRPEEAWMIGDDIYGDIEGALNAGLNACLVRTGKYRTGDEGRIKGDFKIADNVLEAVVQIIGS